MSFSQVNKRIGSVTIPLVLIRTKSALDIGCHELRLSHRSPTSGRGRLRDIPCSCPLAARALSEPLFSNRLLASANLNDRALLEPHFEAVDLPLRTQLEIRNKRISHAYFLESGLASVVAKGAKDSSIEVGIIGREGMTALTVVMGGERAPHDTFIQVAGKGHRVPADCLSHVLECSASLRRLLLRFAHAFFVQTTYTALSNGRSKIDERLARWLLMAHDRLNGEDVPLTQEFLALMLGVHRPGVTGAIKILTAAGLIEHKRGSIKVLDRRRLEAASNGAYGLAEAELEKLFDDRE
jgi:CRP-like cAMP-binding protein